MVSQVALTAAAEEPIRIHQVVIKEDEDDVKNKMAANGLLLNEDGKRETVKSAVRSEDTRLHVSFKPHNPTRQPLLAVMITDYRLQM